MLLLVIITLFLQRGLLARQKFIHHHQQMLTVSTSHNVKVCTERPNAYSIYKYFT